MKPSIPLPSTDLPAPQNRALLFAFLTIAVAALIASLLMLRGQSARAQAVTEVLPNTKLEQAVKQAGTLTVTGFTEIGGVGGEFGTSADVEIRQVTMPSGAKLRGIVVTVNERDLKRTAYVDLEEVAPLFEAINRLSTITSVPGMENFQADYHTRGGLVIAVYSTHRDGKKLGASIKCGGGTAFIAIEGIGVFRGLIEKAQTALAALK